MSDIDEKDDHGHGEREHGKPPPPPHHTPGPKEPPRPPKHREVG